jgi:electron transfer flavoprotein beta subunit
MGADWGIHVTTDVSTDQDLQPLAVAKVFQHMMAEHKFDMCILGKQSIDDDYVQTGQILASKMGVPAATFSSEIEFSDDKTFATVTREVDMGLQKVQVTLPAVFTCDLRLNTPRFANVKSILAAKKKRVDEIKLEDLGIDVTPRIVIKEVNPPAEREGGVLVADVDELIDKLRNEAKVL